MGLDVKWLALCCFSQTEKDRRADEEEAYPFSTEAMEWEERDHERRQREIEYSWWQYMEQYWEH